MCGGYLLDCTLSLHYLPKEPPVVAERGADLRRIEVGFLRTHVGSNNAATPAVCLFLKVTSANRAQVQSFSCRSVRVLPTYANLPLIVSLLESPVFVFLLRN